MHWTEVPFCWLFTVGVSQLNCHFSQVQFSSVALYTSLTGSTELKFCHLVRFACVIKRCIICFFIYSGTCWCLVQDLKPSENVETGAGSRSSFTFLQSWLRQVTSSSTSSSGCVEQNSPAATSRSTADILFLLLSTFLWPPPFKINGF